MAVSSSATRMLPAGIGLPHLVPSHLVSSHLEPPHLEASHLEAWEACNGVPVTSSRLVWSVCLAPENIGISTRKVVLRGCDSHSMMPPWSPTILATSASPSPLPVCLVVTNGSNRFGSISSGTPGPLSLTQNS